MESNREPQGVRESRRASQREPERAREPEIARGSQRELDSKPERAGQRARESQRETERARERERESWLSFWLLPRTYLVIFPADVAKVLQFCLNHQHKEKQRRQKFCHFS